MKRILLVIGFILIALLAGCSCGNTEAAVKAQQANDVAAITAVLKPFMEQYKTQYDKQNEQYAKLSSDYSAIQKELSVSKTALSDAQKANAATQAQFAALKAQVASLSGEIGNLNVALQNAVNDKATFEQRYQLSQNTLAQVQASLAAKEATYNTLWAKLTKVNGRGDSVINDYAEASRTTFYAIWDKWWSIVVVGN